MTDTAKHNSPQRRRKRTVIREEGKGFFHGLGRRNVGTYAASTAFFLFLSLIPILILLSSLIPSTNMDPERMSHLVTVVTPDVVDGFVSKLIREAYAKSHDLLPISVVTLIWAASQGTVALLRGLNEAYHVKEHRRYLELLILSIIYTAGLIFLVYVMMTVVFGNQIVDFFHKHMPWLSVPTWFYHRSRVAISFVLAILIFSLLYKLAPAGYRKFSRQLPGAVFTAVVWEIFTFFFQMYIGGFNRYTMFYGSLGTLAIFMFWMYCCFYIFLVGGYINHHFEEWIDRGYTKIKSHRKK
jgi:membrane protein